MAGMSSDAHNLKLSDLKLSGLKLPGSKAPELKAPGRTLPSPKLPIVLFDVDGTIIDSYPGVIGSFMAALDDFGYSFPDEIPTSSILGPPLTESFLRVGVPEEEVAAVRERYLHHYVKEGRWAEYRLYPGVLELIESLHGEGYVLATATSKGEEMTEVILAHAGIRDFFDFVGAAAADGSRPTKGHVVAHTLAHMQATITKGQTTDMQPPAPYDMVLIGDRIHDYEGSAEHGLRSIAARWGYGTQQEWEHATYQAHTPAEVKELIHAWST